MANGARGQTSIDQIAGPVGESLITTAFGLFVAIPAVIAYNALTRANKVILSKLNRFAHGVHAFFVTGETLTTSRRREPANVGLAGHSNGNRRVNTVGDVARDEDDH
jgi:biopolymer transport protein ExbB